MRFFKSLSKPLTVPSLRSLFNLIDFVQMIAVLMSVTSHDCDNRQTRYYAGMGHFIIALFTAGILLHTIYSQPERLTKNSDFLKNLIGRLFCSGLDFYAGVVQVYACPYVDDTRALHDAEVILTYFLRRALGTWGGENNGYDFKLIGEKPGHTTKTAALISADKTLFRLKNGNPAMQSVVVSTSLFASTVHVVFGLYELLQLTCFVAHNSKTLSVRDHGFARKFCIFLTAAIDLYAGHLLMRSPEDPLGLHWMLLSFIITRIRLFMEELPYIAIKDNTDSPDSVPLLVSPQINYQTI